MKRKLCQTPKLCNFSLSPSLLISKKHRLSKGFQVEDKDLISRRVCMVQLFQLKRAREKRRKYKVKKYREVKWCKSNPVVSWDVLCLKYFPSLFSLCGFKYSVFVYLHFYFITIVSTSETYKKKSRCFDEIKRLKWSHQVATYNIHAKTHKQTNPHFTPVCKASRSLWLDFTGHGCDPFSSNSAAGADFGHSSKTLWYHQTRCSGFPLSLCFNIVLRWAFWATGLQQIATTKSTPNSVQIKYHIKRTKITKTTQPPYAQIHLWHVNKLAQSGVQTGMWMVQPYPCNVTEIKFLLS